MQLETRTVSWLGGDRVAASIPMLVQRSGHLRFDPEIALSGTVATLVTDGLKFALIDFRKRLYQHGPACPDNIAAVLRIPLRAAEVAAILLGDVALPKDAQPQDVIWDGHNALDVLSVTSPSPSTTDTTRLWLGFRRQGLSFDLVSLQGEPPDRTDHARFRVSYEDLAHIEGQAYPGRIKFAEPGKSFDEGVEIKIRERTINPPPRDQAYIVEMPEGFAAEAMPCCRGCEARFK